MIKRAIIFLIVFTIVGIPTWVINIIIDGADGREWIIALGVTYAIQRWILKRHYPHLLTTPSKAQIDVFKFNRIITLRSILFIIIIILINVLSGFIKLNIDFTKENLHSISKQSKTILENLEDKIFIKVYLDGDYPAEFKHLQNSTYDLLKIFKEISPDLIDFEFIDPNQENNDEQKLALFQQLVKKGLAPTDLEIRKMESSVSQIIFPGAIIYYKEKHIAVNFLKNNITISPGNNINASIESLEFEFISAVLHLCKNSLDRIAYLEGNGELSENQVYDITESVMKENFRLTYYFNVDRFNIKEFAIDSATMQPNISRQMAMMNVYKAIIIAKPIIPFNKMDKFLIDQYIMNGGKVLWLIDGVHASMDSLKISGGSFIAVKNNINLDDQLFKYGVRINANLIEDLRSTEIPIITGYSNNIPQQTFFPWPYYPLLFSDSKHAISKGLDAIKCDFVSSIDTISNSIKKTILLHSSKQSRLTLAPAKIGLGILENPPLSSSYNKKEQAIAVLLEGEFESVFKNRILPKDQKIEFTESSSENKMIVISDGDLIANKIGENGTIYPLAYDRYIEYAYPGNKLFLINAIQYLCDNTGVTSLNAKTIRLRMLDKDKINNNRFLIQIINIILPLLLLLLFAVFYNLNQKKKYA